jgi:hypothetical protein
MIVIKALEEQKAIFITQKNELEETRSEIYTREGQAMSDALLPYFEGFSPDAYIEVQRGSVYFKMDHPDYSYKKELFNLYLREDWKFDEKENKKSYTGIDLSYYTTSTKGVDTWELKRLRMLGDLAEIVLKNHDNIVDAANNVSNSFKEEFKRSFDQMNLINKGIRELDDKINTLKSEMILTKLSSEEGVVFDIPQYIELKRTYCPKLNQIKIIEVKGKTCTVEIEMGSSYKTTETRVSIASLVSQIKHYNVL